MFAYVDKQLHGTEQGALLKAEAHAAIENYFQVGLPGGKTLDRFDELVQVLLWPARCLVPTHVQHCAFISELSG